MLSSGPFFSLIPWGCFVSWSSSHLLIHIQGIRILTTGILCRFLFWNSQFSPFLHSQCIGLFKFSAVIVMTIEVLFFLIFINSKEFISRCELYWQTSIGTHFICRVRQMFWICMFWILKNIHCYLIILQLCIYFPCHC